MNRIFLVSLCLFLEVVLVSCSRQSPEEPVVARVNGSPILLPELERELRQRESLYGKKKSSPADVEEQLRIMIDRKLMVHEASRMELYGEEHFVQSVKRFYEQMLIRELIEAKSKEWENQLAVTDEEIEQEYKRMRHRVLIGAARTSDRVTAEKFLRRMRRGERVDCEEQLSCSLGDVKQTPLEHAFDMKAGEIGIYRSDGEFVVISVKQRQKVNLPPLSQVREQVRRTIAERKRQEAMIDWLQALKGSSKITIDKELLSKATNIP